MSGLVRVVQVDEWLDILKHDTREAREKARSYVGRIGRVRCLRSGEDEGPRIGESPEDPIVEVDFWGAESEHFWPSELLLVPPQGGGSR